MKIPLYRNQKLTNSEKINMLQKNEWVTEEIKREIKTFLHPDNASQGHRE